MEATFFVQCWIGTMKFFYVLAFMALMGGQVKAQALNEAPRQEQKVQREQRRVELRSALQSPHQPDEPRDAKKHLSDQERAELRHQLRQQQQGDGKPRP